MYQSELVAMANAVFSLGVYFASPILTFCLPRDKIVYGYLWTTVLNALVYVIDYVNSDCHTKNYQIMKASGLSKLEIWGSAAVVLFGFQLPGIYLLTNFFEVSTDWTVPTIQDYWTLPQLAVAVAIVATTDAVFFLCHRVLHTTMPRTHLLHHCCIYSSQLTNLFFSPLDLACEFTAPVLMIFGLCQALVRCGDACNLNGAWMFALCLSITQAWYSSGHDEWLGGHHVKHHKSVATGYFIYRQYFYTPSKEEQVRHFIVNPYRTTAAATTKVA